MFLFCLRLCTLKDRKLQEHTEVLHRIFKTLDALLQDHRTNPTSASVRLEGSHFDERAATGQGSMVDDGDEMVTAAILIF